MYLINNSSKSTFTGSRKKIIFGVRKRNYDEGALAVPHAIRTEQNERVILQQT